VDGRSDLYSLGIVFYEMLTGTRPYQGADAFETALLHVKGPVPVLPEALGRFQPTLNRLLAKTPDERFANSDELLQALKPLERPQPTAGRRVTASAISAARNPSTAAQLKSALSLSRWLLGISTFVASTLIAWLIYRFLSTGHL
jgi:serine/threonine-protein kinase PpkA